jgi:hypothetical protein
MLVGVDDHASVTRELIEALVAAYPEYVADRVAALGIADERVDTAVAEGRDWLTAQLEAELAVPLERQRSSPLELVREAMRFPTDALRLVGAAEVPRDPAAVTALPGDVFDLAPASSQGLGERAWRAHVAWGMTKARFVAGMVPAAREPAGSSAPVVALVGTDLMDRSRIESVVAAADLGLQVWRNPAAVEEGLQTTHPALGLVDLAHAAAHDAIRLLASRGVPVVAFGPHVDDRAMAAAGALGASKVLARSVFFRRLPDLLPRVS